MSPKKMVFWEIFRWLWDDDKWVNVQVILPNSDVRGEYYYMYFCICICVFAFVYLCAKSLYISEDVRGRESAISATSGGWQEGLAEHYYCVWIGPHKGALGAQHHSSYCHPLPFNNTKQLYYCFVYSCHLLCIFIVILVTPINNNVTIEFLKWLRFGRTPHEGISQIEIWGSSGCNRYWSSRLYHISLPPSSGYAPVLSRLFLFSAVFSSKSQLDVSR